MTLGRALAEARRRLVAAGIPPDEAAVDVVLFAKSILGWDKARLITELSADRPRELEPRFSEWITRRSGYEPSAYIVGVKEFWGLDFRVTPAVLIPRPETELVVEETLRLYPEARRNMRSTGGRWPRIADIGTGSGCIAVALAKELPGCQIVATDVSEGALDVARENAARHGVADRVQFVAARYLDEVSGSFDAIAANPPYVPDTERNALGPTLAHEPEVALFGGPSGLRTIEGVLDTATSKLSPGGRLLMEIGMGQADAVRALVARMSALRLERIREDLQGIPRTAVVRRTSST